MYNIIFAFVPGRGIFCTYLTPAKLKWGSWYGKGNWGYRPLETLWNSNLK